MFFGHRAPVVFTSPFPVGGRQAFTEHCIQGVVRVRGRASITVRTQERATSGANRLSISGVVFLRGPRASMLFRPGESGKAHESTRPVATNVALLPTATSLNVPVSSVAHTDATTSLIWISFVDGSDRSLAAPICVGRASDRPLHIDTLFEVPVRTTIWLSAKRLSKSGSTLELNGEVMILDGITMRMALGPRCNPFGGPAEIRHSQEVTVAKRGTVLGLPAQQVSSAVGGHPLVSVLLQDWSGGDVGEEVPIGWLAELK